jgi:hypothetical protein
MTFWILRLATSATPPGACKLRLDLSVSYHELGGGRRPTVLTSAVVRPLYVMDCCG